MSRRETHSPQATKDAARQGAPSQERNRNPSGEIAAQQQPEWDELFQSFSRSQQEELLALAGRQGILYSHQLPATLNGSAASAGSNLLSRLLSNQHEQLAPSHPATCVVLNGDLDASQREAVARAVDAPDLCLIQGAAGAGRARVVAEIVAQAANRGERVLLMAASATALDSVLAFVATQPPVLAIRCLEPTESSEQLPEPIRLCTVGERARQLAAQACSKARAELIVAEQHYRNLKRDVSAWPRLQELAATWEQLEHRRLAVLGERDQVAAQVRQEMAAAPSNPSLSSLATAVAACTRSHDAEQSRLDAADVDVTSQMDTDMAKLADVSARFAALRPLAEAKERGRWWAPNWWRATFSRAWRDPYRSAVSARERLEENIDRAQARLTELAEHKQRLTLTFHQTCQQLEQEETARREKEFDRQAAAISRGQILLEQEWKGICAGLDPAGTAPETITVASVQQAQTRLQTMLRLQERRQSLIREWLTYLEQNKEPWTGRIAEYGNLVAATSAGLRGDTYFGDSVRNGHGIPILFDLLVLEQADRLAEAELLAAARRARRCVLLGDRRQAGPAPAPQSGLSIASRGHAPAKLKPFESLWDKLHCNPRNIPYAWIQEENRLCCRLRSVVPHQRRYIETERVADFPDIELRILAVPRNQPTLVEVSFPSSVSVEEAKQYIFRELQELAVHATNSSLRWNDESERLVLILSDLPGAASIDIELEAGVREQLARPSANGHSSTVSVWHTRWIEFDKGRGWNRQRAEEWIHKYLGLRDLGRTAVLEELDHT
jgi:hypothetical protein